MRQINTKLYLNSGDWVKDVEQAHHFQKGAEAIKCGVENKLQDVEIVYTFSHPLDDFSIGPIDFSSGELMSSPSMQVRTALVTRVGQAQIVKVAAGKV